VIPVKGYSFDIPTEMVHPKFHLSFKDKGFVATYFDENKWRIAAFGDLSGIDKSFDPRRVRYLKNIVAERLTLEEAHRYENLNTCLRPCPPDDLPIFGSLRFYPNIFLNAGHSGRGTTLGLGTSKVLTELIMEGKSTSIPDVTPYAPRRFNL
jgi:D-amino-acid dehydrogenase